MAIKSLSRPENLGNGKDIVPLIPNFLEREHTILRSPRQVFKYLLAAGTMLVTGNTKMNEPRMQLSESSQPSCEDRPISIINL